MSETVELTEAGDLRLRAEVAARYFPNDALVAVRRGAELWLMPLVGPEGGGLLLKQRNLRGDRSTLIWEVLCLQDPEQPREPNASQPCQHSIGERAAVWDDGNGALRVILSGPTESTPHG